MTRLRLLPVFLCLTCSGGHDLPDNASSIASITGRISSEMQSLDVAADNLESAGIAFLATRNEANLVNLRAAHRQAYLQLKRNLWGKRWTITLPELYDELEGFTAGIFDCTRAGDWELVISNAGLCPVTIESQITAGNLPAGNRQRGLDAMEYMLFDNGAGDSSAAALVAAYESSANRRNFLQHLLTHAVSVMRSISLQWLQTGGFIETINGQSIFARRMQIEEFYQVLLLAIEFSKDAQLGRPAGFVAGTAANTNAFENRHAGFDAASYEAAINGIEALWLGEEGGFRNFVVRINLPLAESADAIIAESRSLASRLARKRGSLRQVYTSDPDAFRRLYETHTAMFDLFKLQISAATGSNPGLAANDGD